ncbi:MarR family winged helix-turn-helix transcriptional regulator [Ornithinimicrobium cryptoxanthini]|uniref:MarR family transcriptional regulator n=1 Tax=Ornithinimicrobium cryptoxanthini TaxID=2934161 RepID=A0ABY4YKA6_9MICO|nr:MarR family transcriptional regulator [Ornithinimicrobium cryptoxanthini]USQ77212.1 MarR family transcriptional regulator [Ornithinimicrobium cryptoxanthini]
MPTRPTPTRWLDSDELPIWVRMVAVLELLPAQLDSHLRRVADLTYFDYYVLAMLSEASARTLRMSSLANHTNATLPRLSHVVRRLEARGLVERTRASDDRRATNARLTETGWEKVKETAPLHVEHVRRLVFDALSPEQVDQLGQITDALVAVLDPDGLMSVPYQPAESAEPHPDAV